MNTPADPATHTSTSVDESTADSPRSCHHNGFYQNMNSRTLDKSQWMGKSTRASFLGGHDEYVTTDQPTLGRKRVPRHKREGRGMIEQISVGTLTVDASSKKTNRMHSSPNLTNIYNSFQEMNQNKRIGSLPGHCVGAGNRSSIVFGDDRIHFKRSFTQEAHKLDPARAQKTVSGYSLNGRWIERSRKQRILDYKEATELIGLDHLSTCEATMRHRLMERTSSGPYQMRKTFKKFDRDGSGEIDFEEFAQTLHLFGLDFNSLEVMALFGRYDTSANGFINFQEFVNKLMEDDYMEITKGFVGDELGDLVGKAASGISVADRSKSIARLNSMRQGKCPNTTKERERVMEIYKNIDTDHSGRIDRSEFEVLCIALGKEFDSIEIERVFNTIDIDNSGEIEIDEFVVWLESSNILKDQTQHERLRTH